ncbi:MAG TPA: SGNH/GDSL hydrolase family protein [Acidimicrobiales bacterium]|nr:SGNH/GDSL hydrolase family protein [Acidimicrobiales bacterium]
MLSVATGCGPGGGSDELLHYVSLGDSFAAGEGLPEAAGPCRRSPRAYPNLLARRTGLRPSLRACSGATTADLLERERHPGEGRQLDWLRPDTDVVTLTVGGNDLGFARIMGACLTGPDPCSRLEEEVDVRLAELEGRLEVVNREIRRRLPQARLLVVGYPRLVADPSRLDLTACRELGTSADRRITAEEADWLRSQGQSLDDLLRRSAEAVGARFVDAAAAFAGHEACSGTPWMRGLAPENLAASFHPNEAGHAALARLVAGTLGLS